MKQLAIALGLLFPLTHSPGCVEMGQKRTESASERQMLAKEIAAAVARYRQQSGHDVPEFLAGFELGEFRECKGVGGDTFTLGDWLFEPKRFPMPCMIKEGGPYRDYVVYLEINGSVAKVKAVSVMISCPHPN